MGSKILMAAAKLTKDALLFVLNENVNGKVDVVDTFNFFIAYSDKDTNIVYFVNLYLVCRFF